MHEGEHPNIKRDQDLGEIVLRGQKKQRAPKPNRKKQNQLRKMRDRDREKETRLGNRRTSGVYLAEPDHSIFLD